MSTIDDSSYQHKTDEYFSVRQEELADFINIPQAIVLDIGCGAGETGYWLKQQGIAAEVHGIELVQTAAQRAEKKLDSVLNENLETIDLEAHYTPATFDYIIATEVLEHLTYPQQLLQPLHSLLKSETGRIIASVPNMQHIRALWHIAIEGDWHYRDSGPFDRTHLRFFTKKSFCRLFEEADYTVVDTRPVLLSKAQTLNTVSFGILEQYLAFRYYCIAQSNLS